jgi:AcrR family transcriptional regulator
MPEGAAEQGESARRQQLAEAATDYALEHGLIGLSLRPLAAAVGTSDRMLLYHFGTKDDLVAAVLRAANDRAVARICVLPTAPTVEQEVVDLWAAVNAPDLDRCQRVYVEAAALGLLGREPYATVVREANARWVAAVAERLVAAGMPRAVAPRAVMLLDAAFMGFQLDLPLESADGVARAVADLAEAVAGIARSAGPPQEGSA